MGFFERLSRYVDDVLLLPDEAREHADRARSHLDGGEPAEALSEASAALAYKPDHPELLYLSGEALLRLGEEQEAERALARVVELDEDHAPARLALGMTLARSSRHEAAVAHLRRAAAQLAGTKESDLALHALAELARCHSALGRPDRAVRELRKAVALRDDDAQLVADLALAMIAAGEPRLARVVASRAVRLLSDDEDDPEVLAAIGDAALGAGLFADAVDLFGRAVDRGAPVRLSLARALAAAGDLLGANEQALRAMDGPPSPEPHRVRAELALKAGDDPGALSALEAALTIEPDDPDTLSWALAVAARVDLGRAVPLAESVTRRLPEDPLARAVLLRAELARGEPAEVLEERLEQLRGEAPSVPETWVAAAEAAIARGDGEAALEALERLEALEPGRSSIEKLASDACVLVASGGSGAEPDLYDVLERAHGILAARSTLSELAVELGRIREDYDKPFLLTVMGEFNAGKSTFINAMIGEPVAPMGITPTTATINVLKYGAERRVRVLQASGTVQEMAYEDLGAWLKGLSRSAAVEVRQVEILYPAEELTRINLVDTPGFNSIVPEHESVARQFIERADAVVWLFDAGQPGKDSERRALESVRGTGKRVLGVLNKADRLDEGSLASVMRYVRDEGLSELLEDVVPLSARQALESKVSPRQGGSEDGGLPLVQEALDRVFYSKARLIKRAGCASRLVSLLDEALARETAANGALRRALQSLDLMRRATASLPDSMGSKAEAALTGPVSAVTRVVAEEAAEEVLEFVRPKRHLLDSHSFGAEDRRYLFDLVDDRLEAAFAAQAPAFGALAEEAIAEVFSVAEPAATAVLGLPSVDGVAHEHGLSLALNLLAIHRGLLYGGRADRFFDDVLPRMELEREAITARIASWWSGHDGAVRSIVERSAAELAGRLDGLLVAEVARVRRQLSERRREGSLPLSGFLSLARRWVD